MEMDNLSSLYLQSYPNPSPHRLMQKHVHQGINPN
jgi:hypothetical protein